MKTSVGHLTYCTNIHPGENWQDHFAQLKTYIPAVKRQVSPDQPFGIGLRLANTASLELAKEANLEAFKAWLQAENCYVFTMNGFPYGGFHHTVVKDQVHAPDWTSADRVAYTIRLFRILAALLPPALEGGISTAPLSYKYWCNRCEEERLATVESATLNILEVIAQLARIHRSGGPLMHLDIEPEPDGLLENSTEYIQWFTDHLLPLGIPFIQDKLQVTPEIAADVIKTHLQLCYDVCHFALVYEPPAKVLAHLQQHGLKVGKLQISAALKADLPPVGTAARTTITDAFRQFNEPVYLHQVIGRKTNGQYIHYPDLPQALTDVDNHDVVEWRSHFHVPLFLERFDVLQSTQDDIREVLALQQQQPFTAHLEAETYTWDVLPANLKLEISDSVSRELNWIKQQL
ncbi:metabolite traffic protein EboE [Chitinophaga nivalis]|uniref:Metabolite traffic protein EboE n=1 Tax=Chitinophaga nivalis TaxID=2991709 RepID=A0ABT3ITC8_9BACT|nr:metabolite traffic protein EboE [Chitinophaga nivalis]MCW3463080.1 metabolite traffic protein EboE [Chitinophaga nivalis]MCW3487230.1 metabolite traffic protein EboE [Chitinophaga nivalis]